MPVRPPASTPAALSIYEVMGLRPKIEPIIVAMASTAKAWRLFGKSPFSSEMPRGDTTASIVPVVSRKSMKRKKKSAFRALDMFPENFAITRFKGSSATTFEK